MKNKLILFFVIIAVALGAYSAYKYVHKQKSPFKTYAHLFPNTYRTGFENITTEYQNKELTVIGSIPEWLSGTLYRNGPAQFTTHDSWVSNWFDGLAMIHAFTINNGTVQYSNAFLQTTDYKHVQNTGTMNYAGFLQDPCGSLFRNIFCWFKTGVLVPWPLMPNANVNIATYNNTLVALTEIPLPVAFDPHTLKTAGVFTFEDALPIRYMQDTAHPQYDPIRKEHIGYFTHFGTTNTVNVYAIADGTQERRIITSYESKRPSYMHSFAITEHYAILMEIPLTVNPLSFITGKPFINNYAWHPEHGTTFVVIDRIQGAILGTYKTIPFFAFHTVNAYEDDAHIVLDVVIYDTPQVIQEACFEKLLSHNPGSTHAHFERFTLHKKDGSVTHNRVSPYPLELPRINYAYNTKPYTFMYGVHSYTHSYVADKLIKLNVNNGNEVFWHEAHCYPGEPVFIARPHATTEDDGVVVSVVLNTASESFLLILNASDFTEIARIYTPHTIPLGIHGQFYPKNT